MMRKFTSFSLVAVLIFSTFFTIVSTYAQSNVSVLGFDSPGSVGGDWEMLYTFPNGGTFSTKSYLENNGFVVDLYSQAFESKPLTLDNLVVYDVIVLSNWIFDDPAMLVYESLFASYVHQGGGLVFTGQAGFPSSQLDEMLGFHFIETPWSYYVDAQITNFNHPVFEGLTELPKAGGVFVDWDTLIAEEPLPQDAQVLARTTGTGGYYDPDGVIALLAFQSGMGRVVVGPWDGMMRPYGPTSVNSWNVISEPIQENVLLINAINWVAQKHQTVSFYPPYDDAMSGSFGKTSGRVGPTYASYDASFDSATGEVLINCRSLSVLGAIGANAEAWFGDSWVCSKTGTYKLTITWDWKLDVAYYALPGHVSIDATIKSSIFDMDTGLLQADESEKLLKIKEKTLDITYYTEMGISQIELYVTLTDGSTYGWDSSLVAKTKAANVFGPGAELPGGAYSEITLDGKLLSVIVEPFTG